MFSLCLAENAEKWEFVERRTNAGAASTAQFCIRFVLDDTFKPRLFFFQVYKTYKKCASIRNALCVISNISIL